MIWALAIANGRIDSIIDQALLKCVDADDSCVQLIAGARLVFYAEAQYFKGTKLHWSLPRCNFFSCVSVTTTLLSRTPISLASALKVLGICVTRRLIAYASGSPAVSFLAR